MSDSMFSDHFILLVLFATLLASFLALLWRDAASERWRFFARLWIGLVGGSVIVAWCLFLFPR